MNATQCPPRHSLRDYLAGKLGPHDSDVLERHLLTCHQCEQTAAELDHEPDTLVELLQDCHGHDVQAASGPEAAGEVLPANLHGEQAGISPSLPADIASYELLRRLGGGGMGAVYLAKHKKLDKQVAIKLLPALPARMPEFVARFQREMRAAGKLEHPAIVRSTDAGEENGIHFLVMDAIDGLDLSRIARTQDNLAIADACEVVRQAALGLSHAHSKGIVHRDIKPSNLMLDTEGQVRILDFGLAQLGLWDSGSAEITSVGQLMGTLDYMAPEQAEHGGAVDYRADLYSLGATLFRLLTGRAPLAAAPDLTPLEKLRLLSTHRAPQLRTLRDDVPVELSELVDSLLARGPSKRPASAAHAAELLQPFCQGAGLALLLARARSCATEVSTDRQLDSFPAWTPWLPQTAVATAPASNTTTDAGDQSRRRGSWVGRLGNWALLALSLALICGGILFVLEMGKGQLVIESDDAAVQVRLVKDGQQVDELHIQPGTQATRLRGGKYEIVIDAPSDNFAVTANQVFTIRNGQTVVARITSQPKGASTSEIVYGETRQEQSSSAVEDKRLHEIVYEGETLDVWLRRLKFERSDSKLKEALAAVEALANENAKDLIVPAVTEFMLDPTTRSREHLMLAFNALGAASKGSTFLKPITTVLEGLQGDPREKTVFFFAVAALSNLSIHDASDIRPFLDWAGNVLHERSSSVELQRGVAHLLMRMLVDRAGVQVCDACQQAVLSVLRSVRSLPYQDLWFMYYEGFEYQSPWYKPFQAEVTHHAIATIAAEDSSEPLVTQAALVLASTTQFNNQLSSQQRSLLAQALSKRILQAAQKPDEALSLIDISPPAAWHVEPFLPNVNWKDVDYHHANELVSLLNAVDRFQLQDALQSELLQLHAAFEQQALWGTPFARYRDDAWGQLRGNSIASEVDRRVLLQQLIFLQSGTLVGKDQRPLEARFGQQLSADIAKIVDEQLDILEFGPKSKQPLALRTLSELLGMEHAARAVPALIATIRQIEQTSEFFRLALDELARVSGDDFFDHLAKLLAEADGKNRSALLAIDFSFLNEVHCSDPSSLDSFLGWTDSIFASAQAVDVQIQSQVAEMLRSLLRDRSRVFAIQSSPEVPSRTQGGAVSDACQQAVVSHLETYPQLSDENFWLAEPVGRFVGRGQGQLANPMDRVFRSAMLAHAIRVLKQETTWEAEPLKAQALMVIRDVVRFGDDLTPAQQQWLQAWLTDFMTAAADDLHAATAVCVVDARFTFLTSPMFQAEFAYGQDPGGQHANLLVLSLNLIMELQWMELLAAPLEKLHAAVGEPEITVNHLQPGGNHWHLRIKGYVPRGGSLTELLIQTVFVQTGVLLGKDFNELVNRPEKLARAKLEEKRRFVQPGDTLAVYIPGILPQDTLELPVMQAGTRPPVTGYPVPVDAEGEIRLPLLSTLAIQGKELAEVRHLLMEKYTGFIDEVGLQDISVKYLLRSGEQLELRNIVGAANPRAAAESK